jgi:hypothetical protein
MSEQHPIRYAAVAASIERGGPEDDVESTIAVKTLVFLAEHADKAAADPGPVAHLAVLDLCAALLAFGGVRGIEDLVAWLREELPARARELALAVGASSSTRPEAKPDFHEIPPGVCLRVPDPAPWH